MEQGCEPLLKENEAFVSFNKKYWLVLKDNGKLYFLDHESNIIWESIPPSWFGRPPYSLVIDKNEGLAIEDKLSHVVWHATLNGNGSFKGFNEELLDIRLYDNGQFQINNNNYSFITPFKDSMTFEEHIPNELTYHYPGFEDCHSTEIEKEISEMDSSSSNHAMITPETNIKYYENEKEKFVIYLMKSRLYFKYYDNEVDSYRYKRLLIYSRNSGIYMAELADDAVFRVYNVNGQVLYEMGEPCPKRGRSTLTIVPTDAYLNDKNYSDEIYGRLKFGIVITNALGEEFYYPSRQQNNITTTSSTSSTSSTSHSITNFTTTLIEVPTEANTDIITETSFLYDSIIETETSNDGDTIS
eukprot:jgi/Orpsp1_1/1190505/evm.model.d7180000079443.1